jgi:hypothetical protein
MVVTTEDSKRAKRTHFGLANTAQTRVLIGFPGKIAFYSTAPNYQDMKILAGRNGGG